MNTTHPRRVTSSQPAVSPVRVNHLVPFPAGNGLFSITGVDYVSGIPDIAIVIKKGGANGNTIAYLPFEEEGDQKEFVIRTISNFVLGTVDIPNGFNWQIAYDDYLSELTEPVVMQPVPETNKGKKPAAEIAVV